MWICGASVRPSGNRRRTTQSCFTITVMVCLNLRPVESCDASIETIRSIFPSRLRKYSIGSAHHASTSGTVRRLETSCPISTTTRRGEIRRLLQTQRRQQYLSQSQFSWLPVPRTNFSHRLPSSPPTSLRPVLPPPSISRFATTLCITSSRAPSPLTW